MIYKLYVNTEHSLTFGLTVGSYIIMALVGPAKISADAPTMFFLNSIPSGYQPAYGSYSVHIYHQLISIGLLPVMAL